MSGARLEVQSEFLRMFPDKGRLESRGTESEESGAGTSNLPEKDETSWPESPDPMEIAPDAEPSPQPQAGGQRGGRGAGGSPRSPDGKWTAFVKDNNVFLRATADKKETQLSQDGKPGLAFGLLQWAPDSKTLAAWPSSRRPSQRYISLNRRLAAAVGPSCIRDPMRFQAINSLAMN